MYHAPPPGDRILDDCQNIIVCHVIYNRMDGDSAWKHQQALERQSTAHVSVVQQPITGGDVCVWDAFGAFWCEKGDKHKMGHNKYVQNVTQQGKPLVYEGFCGCGADTP